MRASGEQIQAILLHLGTVEASRRRIEIHSLTREQASELLKRLNGSRRVITGAGRPKKPLSELPEHQQRLIKALASDPDDPRHGTTYSYGAGRCKCDRCRAAGRK